jgi:hypothetical protein
MFSQDAWRLEGDAWQQNGSGLENTLSAPSGPVHMELHNRPGLDRMVVTSNSPQHHMQHRQQHTQPDQYRAPAGTGEFAAHLLVLCDFSMSHRFVHLSVHSQQELVWQYVLKPGIAVF